MQQPGGGSAKGMPGTVQSVDQRVKRMTRHLDLDEQQADQVREILQSASENRPDVKDMSRYEALPSICRHTVETDRRIKAVLNDEQAVKFQQAKEQRKARQAQNRDCSQYEKDSEETP